MEAQMQSWLEIFGGLDRDDLRKVATAYRVDLEDIEQEARLMSYCVFQRSRTVVSGGWRTAFQRDRGRAMGARKRLGSSYLGAVAVQACPRRRASPATNDRRGGQAVRAR